MSSSESAGGNSPDVPAPRAPRNPKKDRAIGLGIIGVCFLFALGLSNYSANKTAEATKKSVKSAE